MIQKIIHGRYQLYLDGDGTILVYIQDKYIGLLGNSLITMRGEKIEVFEKLVTIK